ncbi:MAG: NAD-dependent epimerase/dehydratase family protein [Desulfobacteraceae bacterium]|nr:NAD-dependent epimerase/dehydratase family protein [Desulfobacteraceae bacterium]
MADLNNKIWFIPSLNVRRNNTISDGFRAVNGKFGMVVTVVEKGNRLCGIASEGDLRRAILKGDSLDTPLEKVMNTEPVVLKIDDLEDELKCTKAIGQINHRYGSGQGQQATIPVVDENRNVVGLVIPEMLPIGEKQNAVVNNGKYGRPQVLVVGGAGYIGSVLVRMLLADGWRVRVLDNMLYMQTSLDGIDNEHLSVMRGDVTNINDVVEVIEEVDAAVYLAEIVGDPACAYRPKRALKTNYLSVANMAHLCAYLNINRFVYTSSCSVYGGSKYPDRYLSEESELNPVSHYGRMKILAERALLGVSSPLFMPTVLRLPTVFGYSYRPRFDLVVNAFAKDAFFRKYIEVFGGKQWRPNVHVRDVARAVIKTLEAPIDRVSRRVFNAGSSKENYTINELAELTSQVFPEVEIRRNKSLLDQRSYRVDFSEFEKILGYHAQIDVLEGLKELKSAFEKGEIENPDDLQYSNVEALRGFDS